MRISDFLLYFILIKIVAIPNAFSSPISGVYKTSILKISDVLLKVFPLLFIKYVLYACSLNVGIFEDQFPSVFRI